MEPLDGLDASFLSLEAGNSRLHVAAVLVLDPPEGKRSLFSPSTRFAQVRRLVFRRLHLVPQLRQRAVRVPFGLHHPVWADDPEFDLDDHLRRASIPAPGGRRELDDLVADLLSRPLDPDRPLWEMVVVEGLEGGRSALVAKLHHAILDGVSGASVLAAFLDLGPRDRVVPFAEEPWDPDPLPSGATLLRYAASGLVRQPEALVDTFIDGVDAMVGVAGHNRELAAAGSSPPPALFSAPRTSLNGTLSSRRRYATIAVPLEDAKMIRSAFGTTINDVLLAAVGGALGRYLEARDEHPSGPLVAMVPVSTRREARVRTGGGPMATGNQVSGMLVALGTDVDDPVARLLAISSGAQVAKAQHRLTGGKLLADIAQVAAPAFAVRAARLVSSFRLFDHAPPPFNVTVSSVQGPEATLWCAGSRVAALYPVGPVNEGVGLNVTSMTYQGSVHFGLLGCRRLIPDVFELAVLLDDAFGELAVAALDARGATG